MPRRGALAALLAASGGAAAPPSPWQGLTDGLTAWNAFRFEGGNFTFKVVSMDYSGPDGRPMLLFRYPGPSPDVNISSLGRRTSYRRIIGGGRRVDGERLLDRVTDSFVEDIMAGREPGDPASTSTKGVWRLDALQRGGGVSLQELAKLAGVAHHSAGDKWEPLREGIRAWAKLKWDVNFTFNVGDKDGTLFNFQQGSVGMQGPRLPGASLSKWPAAMTIAGLVADGTMSFDDKASKYLPWWATEPNDVRSGITLRHLLTFQSGYQLDSSPPSNCSDNPAFDYLTCARELYEASNVSLMAPPGTTFTYLSCHLQFAGAMAVAASGLSPDLLFKKYLYQPLGMTNTTWGEAPFKNPQFATGIQTIGADLEKFARGMLTYQFLGKAVLDEAERDWSAPPVSPCGDGWFGHYAMGHWFDCLGYAAGRAGPGGADGASAALPRLCLDEDIPAGPGAFGYYNLIDRRRGYYMQIVLAEDPDCRSEIPEYLRAAAKPLVDLIVRDRYPESSEILRAGGGVTLAEIADIYKYIPPQCDVDPSWPF